MDRLWVCRRPGRSALLVLLAQPVAGHAPRLEHSQAPNHPITLPMLGLFIYEGEVIGALFEAHERDGWKPWYDEPEGQAVSHDGGPRHYSHIIMFKKGPSAEQCKVAKGPLGR